MSFFSYTFCWTGKGGTSKSEKGSKMDMWGLSSGSDYYQLIPDKDLSSTIQSDEGVLHSSLPNQRGKG